MISDLNVLLNAYAYQAFDVDEQGRVLVGTNESGSVQLAEIAPDGSVNVLTALPGPCSGRYVPGRRAVIVSHDKGGDERHQISLLPIPAAGGEPAGPGDLEPLVSDPRFMHVLADVGGEKLCYLTNRRDGVAFDPVIRDLSTGAERTLRVGDHRFEEARLSPDGRWLAVTVSSPRTANSEHVALVDLAGEESLIPVTTPDAPAWNGALCWTPDSATLVYSSDNDREFIAVARFDLATRTRTWLVTDDAADLTGWLSPDGKLLLVERNDDGASTLALHSAVTGQPLRAVPLPSAGCVRDARIPSPLWAPDSAAIIMSLSGPQVPGDVLAVNVADGASRVRELTRSVSSLDEITLAAGEPHRIPAAGGELVPCMVYRAAPETGSAVVVVHGGPEGQARQRFDVYVQALVAAGHTVLVPNVRGSAGYGKRWYSADDGRRRLDSVADLAALHAYLPSLGLDQSRAALWGGSYGGYMVLAGLAFQPQLWAAGVDIVGIASLVTFLENTSAYRRAYREREYGTLAHDREFLHEASPLTHVDQITAPLFIIHGANDPRVPLSEAEQIHAALTARGRECELHVYPDEGHGLAKRANRADSLPKATAFLARHLT